MMKKGDIVHWNWAKAEADGTIKQKFDGPIQKTIKGSKVKRRASKDNPAFLIEQENGNKVLKSGSELQQGPKAK